MNYVIITVDNFSKPASAKVGFYINIFIGAPRFYKNLVHILIKYILVYVLKYVKGEVYFFMSFYENLQKLAKDRGVSFNKIETELGLGKNSLYNYKKTEPTAQKIKELANFFEISTDKLLSENKYENFMVDKEKALSVFRKEQKRKVENFRDSFRDSLDVLSRLRMDDIIDEKEFSLELERQYENIKKIFKLNDEKNIFEKQIQKIKISTEEAFSQMNDEIK